MIVSVQQTADKHKQEMSKLFSQIQELHGHLQKEKVSSTSNSKMNVKWSFEISREGKWSDCM